MKKVCSWIFPAGFLLFSASLSFACGIEGSAARSDGSKVGGTAKVSTSWNGNTAHPRDGYYNLELGDKACGESVEVYVNGYSIGKRSLPKSGNAHVGFVLKGTGDVPVR
jgi:hypothetical protein